MSDTSQLERLRQQAEYLVGRIEKCRQVVLRFEAASEAYAARVRREVETESSMRGRLQVSDYLNLKEKRAIKAAFWMSEYQKELAKVRKAINRRR